MLSFRVVCCETWFLPLSLTRENWHGCRLWSDIAPPACSIDFMPKLPFLVLICSETFVPIACIYTGSRDSSLLTQCNGDLEIWLIWGRKEVLYRSQSQMTTTTKKEQQNCRFDSSLRQVSAASHLPIQGNVTDKIVAQKVTLSKKLLRIVYLYPNVLDASWKMKCETYLPTSSDPLLKNHAERIV